MFIIDNDVFIIDNDEPLPRCYPSYINVTDAFIVELDESCEGAHQGSDSWR